MIIIDNEYLRIKDNQVDQLETIFVTRTVGFCGYNLFNLLNEIVFTFNSILFFKKIQINSRLLMSLHCPSSILAFRTSLFMQCFVTPFIHVLEPGTVVSEMGKYTGEFKRTFNRMSTIDEFVKHVNCTVFVV